MGPETPVLACHPYPENGDLIVAAARLGWIWPEAVTLDPTYEHGTWWKRWKPDVLVGHDLQRGLEYRWVRGQRSIDSSRPRAHLDFTVPPETQEYDCITYDPPYKLNGRATPALDARYGVDSYAGWKARHQLCKDGATALVAGLKPGGTFMWKCMDQVNSGHVRWQTVEFANHGLGLGLTLEDRIDRLPTITGGRPQPARTSRGPNGDRVASRQEHAYGRPSTLLIFKKPQRFRRAR